MIPKFNLTLSCLKKYKHESALSTKNLLLHFASPPGKTDRLSFHKYPKATDNLKKVHHFSLVFVFYRYK